MLQRGISSIFCTAAYSFCSAENAFNIRVLPFSRRSHPVHQPKLADQFLEFMTSQAFQSIIPTTNWMYPAVFPTDGLPAGFEKLITPSNSLIIPADKAQEARDKALAEWLTALSR
jgi:ABC-type thiamine transport system substrate-binding protein